MSHALPIKHRIARFLVRMCGRHMHGVVNNLERFLYMSYYSFPMLLINTSFQSFGHGGDLLFDNAEEVVPRLSQKTTFRTAIIPNQNARVI